MLALQLLCGAVWVQPLSATLQSVCRGSTYRTVHRGQTGVLNRFQIKRKGDRQNAKGLIKYLIAEPSGSKPLTTKSAIRRNPEQVSSNHYPSIYVWHSSEYYFPCSRFPRGCFERDCAIKILYAFLVSYTSLPSRHKGTRGKQLHCKSECNYLTGEQGGLFVFFLSYSEHPLVLNASYSEGRHTSHKKLTTLHMT